MQKRRSVFGVSVSVGVVVGMLTMASGCVAPSESQDPTAASEAESAATEGETGLVSQAVNNTATCNITSAQKIEGQRRATRALQYLLGKNLNTLSGCSAFKPHASVIQAAVRKGRMYPTTTPTTASNGALMVTATSDSLTCGISANIVTVTEYNTSSTANPGPLWSAIGALALSGGAADTCFGAYTSTFLMLSTNSQVVSGGRMNWAEWDPTLATLNAGQSLSSSSSAAAITMANTGDPGTAYYLGGTFGSCGTFADKVGEPCSSLPLSAGAKITKVIVRDYVENQCACKGT